MDADTNKNTNTNQQTKYVSILTVKLKKTFNVFLLNL